MLFKKFFNNKKTIILQKYLDIVAYINSLENKIKKLSDNELKKKTIIFKQMLLNGCTLESILPEVFAVCREASRRVFKMRHFDVQLIGGIALHFGKIVEMNTGEGKTLMSTLASYLNSLLGKGVHIVTVNDYLAKRDFKWMSFLYNWLGVSVGVNLSNFNLKLKRESYNFDITYGSNNEFGFDYLKDNIIYLKNKKIQRKLNFVVIDEIDSILIDEARVPLILSVPIKTNVNLCLKINLIPKQLKECKNISGNNFLNIDNVSDYKGDFVRDKKNFQIWLTDSGYEKVEKILIKMNLISEGYLLYNNNNIMILYYLYASLRAHFLYFKNQHYIIYNGLIVIIDEFTGRLTIQRRWGDGLHQALEAKEGLKIRDETQIMASITFQNYFRMYKKISGMTGTASTEAYEFKDIYNLDVITIPSNKKNIRIEYEDKIYITKKAKYKAIIKDICSCYKLGQPVLVGTSSINKTKIISYFLKEKKIPHNILNAKYHKKEAYIISQAGKFKAITIATNMAGRGIDIILGGNLKNKKKKIINNHNLSIREKEKKIKKLEKKYKILNKNIINLGGLKVIGCKRHESRRIDNQLKGRSARQGDPGSSCFYLSLEDSLLKEFYSDNIKNIIKKINFSKDEFIESSILTKAIELAQKKIEIFNFNIRKKILEYDDILNNQRKIIYKERNFFLNINDITKIVLFFIKEYFIKLFKKYILINSKYKKYNLLFIDKILNNELKINFFLYKIYKKKTNINKNDLLNILLKKIFFFYKKKIIELTFNKFNNLLRSMILRSIDYFWKEHLFFLEYLKQGIYLKGYIQKDPKREYFKESFKLFKRMLNLIKEEIVKISLTLTNKYFVYLNFKEQEFLNDINYIKLHNKHFKYSIYNNFEI